MIIREDVAHDFTIAVDLVTAGNDAAACRIDIVVIDFRDCAFPDGNESRLFRSKEIADAGVFCQFFPGSGTPLIFEER